MFVTVKDRDLIVLTKKDYLETEILAKFEYPFIEVSIFRREDLENNGPTLAVFSTENNPEMFEIMNKRIILKMYKSEEVLENADDYHYVVTGIEEDGRREEIIRYVVAIRHG